MLGDFARRFFFTIVRPLDVFDDVVERDEPLAGVWPVLFAGVVWATFCVWLALDGREPSFVGNPLPPAQYYWWQAGFVTPLLLVSVALFAGLCHTGASWFGGDGTFTKTLGGVGYAYAVPLVVVFLIPDVVMYRLGGFAELPHLLRVSGPVTALWVVFLSSAAVARAQRISFWGAAAVVAPAFVVQGLLAGLFVR